MASCCGQWVSTTWSHGELIGFWANTNELRHDLPVNDQWDECPVNEHKQVDGELTGDDEQAETSPQ